MTMSNKTRTMLGYIGVGLATALITAGVVWAVVSAQLAEMESLSQAAEVRVADLQQTVDSLQAELDQRAATVDDPAEDPQTPDETPPPAESGPERQFCFVSTIVLEEDAYRIAVDYAQMLTGQEAVDAATEAGAESPPPNDYFIANDNPMLRTFDVDSDVRVKLSTRADGVEPEGYFVTLDEWRQMFVGTTPDMGMVRDIPYWITLDGETVTAIEEQFLP
jgi:hypothetical protein